MNKRRRFKAKRKRLERRRSRPLVAAWVRPVITRGVDGRMYVLQGGRAYVYDYPSMRFPRFGIPPVSA